MATPTVGDGKRPLKAIVERFQWKTAFWKNFLIQLREKLRTVQFRNTLPGLWLHFSVHLVVLFAFGILALRSAYGTRRLLGLLALVIAVDTVFVLFFAGFFSGVALLAVAAICFTLAAFLSPLSREPQLDESNIEQDVL